MTARKTYSVGRTEGGAMKRILVVALAVAMAALLQACSETTSSPTPLDQSAKIESIEKQISNLQMQMQAARFFAKNILEQTATVDTSQEVYGVARNQFGAFTVIAKSIVPHLDGYRVRLEIGNPTLATFHGANLKIEWGPQITHDTPPEKIKTYLDARRSKEFSVTTVFAPGAYTGVDVVLTPAAAKDVGEIEVAIRFSSLSLRRQAIR